ncbi:hypothetical protein CR513_12017, partial [Mucuna pruriens]
MGFQRCNYNSCVYILKKDAKILLYLLLYVDDILLASSKKDVINRLKSKLNFEFEIKELGEAKRILGMDISKNRSKEELFLSQQGYIKKVVEKVRMHDKLSIKHGPITNEERNRMTSIQYASRAGSIMYGMVCSRLDLVRVINMGALKWILKYLNSSLSSGLRFKRKLHDGDAIKRYVNFDYVGHIDTRKSLFGYVFTLFGTTISWRSILELVAALSTTQAEFIVLIEGVKEAMWIKGLIVELGIAQNNVTVFCDSYSDIHIYKHQVYHDKSKHINVKLHFIRDVIETKSLPYFKFKHCLDLIGFSEE